MPLLARGGGPSRTLPGNVQDWPLGVSPGRRRLRTAVLKAVLPLACAAVLVVLVVTFIGFDQLARWVASPSLPEVPTIGLQDSRNWAGYAATNGTYTEVRATWSVPVFAPDSPAGSDAIWVGIGGVRGSDLVQAGTQETVSSLGSTKYEAWIEMLPQPPQTVPLAITSGDSVTVSLVQQQPEEWLVVIANNTSGKSYQTDFHYRSSLSSAEWVVEAPSARRGRVLPMDRFGTITFSQASAVKNGQRMSVAEAGGRAITMLDRSGRSPLARPSQLRDDGAGFSVQ